MKLSDFDEDKSSSANIKTIGRSIYFYSDVSEESALTLLEQLKALNSTPSTVYRDAIYLYLHSYGGDAFVSLGLVDHIKRLDCPVYSVVSGIAASGATLISTACDKRYITPNSFMLIHQLRNELWGTYAEFKDSMRIMDMIMDRVVSFYADHSKYNEEQIRKLLEHDAWFDAQQALEAGLVDGILK